MTAVDRLRRARRQLLIVLATRVLATAMLAGVSTLFVALAADALIGWSAETRRFVVMLPWLIGALVLASLSVKAYQTAQAATDESIALWFERRIPNLRYALVTRLSLESDAIAASALDQTIAAAPLEGEVAAATRASLLKPTLALLGALALLALLPDGAVGRVTAPAAGDALDRPGMAAAAENDPLATIVVRVQPPAYSGLSAESFDDPATVRALAGTPAVPKRPMPGLLISHSHHNPKTQGELQDMGMTWARRGCLVLIMDHLGHGERRQHPFTSAADYPRPFKVGRQDYYFRYNTGVQLQLVGESLMGWMAWDLMRGVDLLLARPGIDNDRIILLGAVAGGGDPAAVTAALDTRIKAVVPFNFGGPQPDFAVTADADRDFYYFGIADWESTRGLRLGARDGFGQWLVVASVAPRGLVYAHEFAWDRDRDPVWPRLRKVFSWYDAADRLASATGRGTLKGSPPESSHCNNIGPIHRGQVYPTLEEWFGMPAPEEYSRRRSENELVCLTPDAEREFRPRTLHSLAEELGAGRAAEARRVRAGLGVERRREHLRDGWSRLLGNVEPDGDPKVLERHQSRASETVTVERILLGVEPGVVVPVVLLQPLVKAGTRPPVVVGLAQEGKQAFLEQRSATIAGLLSGGAAVCLVDVRGTGETRPKDGSRRHNGAMTSLSATEWLLGQTLVGSRLRDLRSVLRYLQGRTDLNAARCALWGESFAPTNPAALDPAVPLDADPFPHQAEPLGGLLSLLGALFEDGVRAVSVQGGLTGYESLLQGPFFYVPHDALVAGALTVGDLCDLAASLAPRPFRVEGLVDGLNRKASGAELARAVTPIRAAYQVLNAETRLELGEGDVPPIPTDRWLLRALLAE